MNKFTLDRWAPIGASVATLGIDLSSIPAEPIVKLKGNRHVSRVKSRLVNCSIVSGWKTRWTGKRSWWKLLG